MLRGYVDVWKRGFLEPRAPCPPLPSTLSPCPLIMLLLLSLSLFAVRCLLLSLS